jgi:hypothetical protein
VEIVAGAVRGIAIEPIPGDKTGVGTLGHACESESHHKNKINYASRFSTHDDPPYK